MDRTWRSFKDKWANNPDLAFASTQTQGSEIQRWILDRNGFADLEALSAYLAPRRRILDAGCGNGRVTALLARCAPETAEIVAIDFSSAAVARRNLTDYPNVTVAEMDILGDLTEFGHFDFIYCQEVLHHTTDPERGFANLADRLAPGGEIAIYVYKKKAPVREFTDDFLREVIRDMSYEEAMETARAIAAFGRALSSVEGEVAVPKIEALDIPAGSWPVQRLVYHFFFKCFWNPELSLEENAAINFDWYHPERASRHTRDEVRRWFETSKLRVIHERVDAYGITIRGRREA